MGVVACQAIGLESNFRVLWGGLKVEWLVLWDPQAQYRYLSGGVVLRVLMNGGVSQWCLRYLRT